MKRLSKIAVILSAACMLSGVFAFAACDQKSTSSETPQAHTHTYGDTWAIVAPTDSATGSATKVCSGCEEGTEGHEIVLTLPVLSDAGYTKTADAATCEEGGEVTYSITVEGNAVSFPVATPAKGHTLGELHSAQEADCEQAGNLAYYECEVCHNYFSDTAGEQELKNVFIPARGHSYVEHAANAETCEADGNEKYYTCENCNKYFDADKTECQNGDWVIAKHHTYGAWSVTPPTAENQGSATKTCTKCDEGTNGHTVTLDLPALTQGNLTKYSVEHNDGTDKYTYEFQGEQITFEVDAAPVDPTVLHLGTNTITMTDTYASVDIYNFTVAEEKTYYFTIEQNMLDTFYFLTVTLDGTDDGDGGMIGGRTIYDSYSSQNMTFYTLLTASSHKLCFSAGAKGKFTLTIADTAPAVDPEAGKLSLTNTVNGGEIGNDQTFTAELADSVEEGWYCVYLQPYPILGRANLTVQINDGEEIVLDANRGDNTQDAFSVYAYLKGGDKITYKNTGYENAPILVNLAAHSHDPKGEWQITVPTEDVAGKAERKCGEGKGIPETFVLPPLNDGGYSTQGVDGGTKYKITVNGVEIEFTVLTPGA